MTEEQLTNILQRHIPPPAGPLIAGWLKKYKVELTIKWDRGTRLGDYRAPHFFNGQHRITVNVSLNKYAFMLTLVHELAHLLTFIRFGNKVLSHGSEWKNEFKLLMANFIGKAIFPEDVEKVLIKYMNNPAASSCTDAHLLKTLNRYNQQPVTYVEDLPTGSLFELNNNRTFKKGEKLRKNYRCVEIPGNQIYLVNALAEVKKVHPIIEARNNL